MKKKDLKKISKYLYEKLDGIRAKKSTPKAESEMWSDENDVVSQKIINLIENMINYPDSINIHYTESYFRISTYNIKNIKSPKYSEVSSEEDYLQIEVYKDRGFYISYGYRNQSRYKDVNLFNNMIDIIKNKVKEINDKNFILICEKISKESGLIRDENLKMLE